MRTTYILSRASVREGGWWLMIRRVMIRRGVIIIIYPCARRVGQTGETGATYLVIGMYDTGYGIRDTGTRTALLFGINQLLTASGRSILRFVV